jgi:hypothetical protein
MSFGHSLLGGQLGIGIGPSATSLVARQRFPNPNRELPAFYHRRLGPLVFDAYRDGNLSLMPCHEIPIARVDDTCDHAS